MCAATAMLALIALVVLISRVLIIANAGVLYLLVVIASALWLGTGPAILALLLAIGGVAYLYAPIDRDLAVTGARLVVVTIAQLVAVVVARLARREQSRADAERQRFQTVVEHAPAGIAVLRGQDFVFELINPAYQAMAPGKKIMGRTVSEAWPELAHQVLPLLRDVLRTGEAYHAIDMPLPVERTPGEPVAGGYFTFSYIPMRRLRGWVDAILVLVVETTEHVLARRRVEEQRERAEQFAAEAEALSVEREEHLQRLQELDQLKDDFLSTAAHELKTPVTSLRGFAQTLLRQQEKLGAPEPQRLAQTLHIIDEQSQKLARIVNELLDVTRIEDGTLQQERQLVDVVGIVEGVAAAARLQTTRHTIRVVAPARVEIFADPLHIEQVIANLMDNAVRYSPDGGPIDIAVAVGDGAVEIAVRDHGIGIPPEKRAHLFGRFYRAHQGGERSGLGLGLYISNQIVAMHGGRIAVDFPPDGGARFVVTLPPGKGAQSADSQGQER